MNILVFSNSAWDDTKSLGNTMSNFFSGDIWKKDNFSNIYLRNAMPNNNVCKDYYRMTLLDMMKNSFSKEKIGKHFILKDDNTKISLKSKKEQKYIDIIHKYSLNLVYVLADYFFRRKKWLTNNLKKYIKEKKPDIVFAFLSDVAILKPLIKYIKDNTGAKVVLFAADDVYGAYRSEFYYRRKKLRKEFGDIVNMSDQLYGISKELCNVYSEKFNKNFKILYKGCTFDFPKKQKVNDNIKFVYAGNLFYGRLEILSEIAKAIKKCNKKDNKASLEIYTAATITDEIKNKLNIPGISTIMGKREYEEIKRIENKADYVLHVESFEKKNIELVKYSFSTKIIDCLQSGSCLVGIGPRSISSIKYINNIPGAYVIYKIEDIDKEIEKLILNKNDIVENSNKTREFAIKNHEITKNQNKLRQDFIELCNKQKKVE